MTNLIHIVLYIVAFLLTIAGVMHNWMILRDMHKVGLAHIKTPYNIHAILVVNIVWLCLILLLTGILLVREILFVRI